MQAWEEDQTREKLMNRNFRKAMKTAKTKKTYLSTQIIVTIHPTPRIKVVNSSLFRQVGKLNLEIKETQKNSTFHVFSKRG